MLALEKEAEAEAAKLAKAEALHQSKQTSSAVKNNTSRKQQHQHQQPEFILPPKRSEMKSNKESGSGNSINIKAPEVKISEEDARRLAIMAAVAAARLEKQLKNESDADSASRKATIDDILGGGERVPTKNDGTNEGSAEVKGFRKQVEYGPKKFIKP